MRMNDAPAEREFLPQTFEFESMNLQVGVRLQLLTHRRLKPVQHFSTLIGWLKDEYLIVKIPLEKNAPIALTEGERVTIRVFSGVNVCSFACTVERVFGRPLFYAHLSFPRAIQGTSLRTAMRVRVDIAAQLNADWAGVQDCLLTNLSVNGARVETREALPRESGELELAFKLVSPANEQDVPIRTRAAIRNVNVLDGGTEQSAGFAYGVQFVDLDPVHFTLLQNLTYEVVLADRQRIV
ncbi:flagellar brake protein [Massilia sp. YIM B02763]|uniref:flagellar brake protein n=1 Tax=Massilia sp. YIM B02763 TaxID=3050130 RepID=UPI0025B6D072|nr:flagellar brake protein [Massilia sp. YIM B02763]MDN4055339.1 flagellar brake protein [Massilia sp. YIM B02763]